MLCIHSLSVKVFPTLLCIQCFVTCLYALSVSLEMQTSHNQEGIPLSDINSGRRWIVAWISIQHWWMMYWLSCPVTVVWIAWALVWLLTCQMEKWDVLSWQYSLDTSLTYLRREKNTNGPNSYHPNSLFPHPHLQTSTPFRLFWRLGCPHVSVCVSRVRSVSMQCPRYAM